MPTPSGTHAEAGPATRDDYRYCPYDYHTIDDAGQNIARPRLPKAEVVRAIARCNPARVPCWYNWFSQEFWALHTSELTALVRAYPNDFIMVMPAPPHGWQPDARGANEFGVWTHHAAAGVGGQRAGSYLDDWASLPAYLARYIPNASAPGRLDHVHRIVAAHPDTYIMGHWAFGPFEQLHAIRGMQRLMEDLYINPEEVQCLGERLVGYWLGLIRGFAAAGVDGIFFTDDWGSQDRLLISPRLWRQIFRPWYRQLFDECHSLGMHVMLHSCGNIREIMDDLVELGLDVLNPIQPRAMDADQVVARYGGRLTFCGGIDVQEFLVHSTPQEVERGIREILTTFNAPGGGFIASPANSVMPETPLANVEAMCRALRRYGRLS
ncbi:MAG: uroporphyrinogen decarboxylase family protein [Anaerolineae bacterium]